MITTHQPDYTINAYGYPNWDRQHRCDHLDMPELYRLQHKIGILEGKRARLLPLRPTLNETLLDNFSVMIFKDTHQLKQQKNKCNVGMRYRTPSRELKTPGAFEYDCDGF